MASSSSSADAALGAIRSAGSERLARPPALTVSDAWAFLAVVLPAVAVMAARLQTVDLAYQIRAGELMLAEGHVLRVDPFTFTMAGRAWTDQQWGGQLVFAGLFRLGGWAALVACRGVMVGLVAFILYRTVVSVGPSRRTSAWICLGGFLVAATTPGSFALRPQLLGVLSFTILLWVLVERDRHPGRLFAVPPLMVLWANLHGSFVLGLALVLLAVLDDLRKRNGAARRTLGVALAATAATLVTPFGPATWRYVWGLSSDPTVRRLISEWQPPPFASVHGLALIGSAAVCVAILGRRRVPWTSWATAAMLGFLAAQAERGIVWWGLGMAVVIGGALAGERPAEPTHEAPSRIPVAIVALGIAAAVALMPWWRVGDRPATTLLAEAPAGLTARLSSTLHPGDRLFAAHHWASWFELTLPRNPLFVDARVELFPAATWRDYLLVSYAGPRWEQVLERWHVGVVAASHEQQEPLIEALRDDPAWREVARDADGAVFVRAENPAGALGEAP